MSIIEGIYLIGLLIYMPIFAVIWAKNCYYKDFTTVVFTVVFSIITCWVWPFVLLSYGCHKLLKNNKIL